MHARATAPLDPIPSAPFDDLDLDREEDQEEWERRVMALAAARIAAERGCKWVRIVLPATGDPLNAEPLGCEGALFRAGFALESLSFRRRPLPVHRASLPPQVAANLK